MDIHPTENIIVSQQVSQTRYQYSKLNHKVSHVVSIVINPLHLLIVIDTKTLL